MASFKKINGRWRASVCVNYRRKSKTFDSKAAASEWARGVETEGINATRHTLHQAMTRYMREVTPTHKGRRWEDIRIQKLQRDPLAAITFEDLQPRHIAEWRDRQTTSASSINREINILSQIINTAIKEWGWCKFNPITQIRRPKPPPPRNRILTDDEVDSFVKHCINKALLQVVLFALETGMRRGEICAIRPPNVQGAVVVLPDSKSGQERRVPLSKRAIELLDEVGGRFDISAANISRLFKVTCDKAGIEGATFHDLRHTALTRLAQLVHILDLMRISGHSDTAMLARYYNPSAEDIAARLG